MKQETINTEITRALTRAYPPVIMSLDDVAAFVGMSYNYVRTELQNQPDFPRKLSRFKTPRFARDDVMKWAEVLS